MCPPCERAPPCAFPRSCSDCSNARLCGVSTLIRAGSPQVSRDSGPAGDGRGNSPLRHGRLVPRVADFQVWWPAGGLKAAIRNLQCPNLETDHLLPDRHSVLISSQTQLQHRGIAPFTMSPPISLARPARSTCSRLHSTISSGTTHAPRHVPIIRSVPQLRRWRKEARSRGLEVGLVPTVSTSRSPTTTATMAVRPVGSKFFPKADQMASASSLCRSSPTKTNFLATDTRPPIASATPILETASEIGPWWTTTPSSLVSALLEACGVASTVCVDRRAS